MSAKPQFLSGDQAAIDDFLAKFDVRSRIITPFSQR
jgi:hypothetical protein